VTSSD
jgi:transcription elongation factor SPT5